MTSKAYSPIRIEKIEFVKQMLQDREFEKIKHGINKPLTILKKIDHIFHNLKKLEDGFSIKEIALILFPNEVSVNEMLVGRKDKDTYENVIIPVIEKTKKTIVRFRRWKHNHNVVLYNRKTTKGEWLYYNIETETEYKDIQLKKARVSLGLTRSTQRFEDMVSMTQKDIKEMDQAFEQKRLKKKINFMKEAKTFDGKPVYQDTDFIGINLIDILQKK